MIQYLSDAEVQCENTADVADALLFLIRSDEDAIRDHLFPDYSGQPVWSLGEFLEAYLVPGSPEDRPGDDPCAEITAPRARMLLKQLYSRMTDQAPV